MMERLNYPLTHEAMKLAKTKTKKPSESKCKGKNFINIGKENEEPDRRKKENETPQMRGYPYLVAYQNTKPKTRIQPAKL